MRLHRSLAAASALLENRARERDEQIRRADAARHDAEDANQTKDQFLAVLGHELRNPLAPSLTALELMKARDPQRVQARARSARAPGRPHGAAGQRPARRLAARARQGAARSAPVRAARSGRSRRRHGRPLLAQQRHTLERLGSVRGPDRSTPTSTASFRCSSNLLTNAAKYTPPGGLVALAAAASAGHVVIPCEDNGPGVPPELMAQALRAVRAGAARARSPRGRARARPGARANVHRAARRDDPRRGSASRAGQPLRRDPAAGAGGRRERTGERAAKRRRRRRAAGAGRRRQRRRVRDAAARARRSRT